VVGPAALGLQVSPSFGRVDAHGSFFLTLTSHASAPGKFEAKFDVLTRFGETITITLSGQADLPQVCGVMFAKVLVGFLL
jgi:hypothetical protein